MTAFAVAPPVRALIRKELREFRHHRMIMMTATVLPIVFLILPIVNLVIFDPEKSIGGINLAVGQAMFCFFLSPVIIPATMSAFSVIGERDQGTLEPLLTLPLTDRQFLAGKVLAIVVPTVAASVAIYVAYMSVVAVVVEGPVRAAALDWTWTFGFLLLVAGPRAVFDAHRDGVLSPRPRYPGGRTLERPCPSPGDAAGHARCHAHHRAGRPHLDSFLRCGSRTRLRHLATRPSGV